MKKLFLFAVAALAMAACSNDELNVQDNVLNTSKEAPVSFDVYTQRGMTRGGIAGTNDNNNIGQRGFGVFAYYTIGEGYDAKATPNFMYNQKIYLEGNAVATPGSLWKYEPVKYWPNEFGNDAQADEVDQLSFFAYAPWTEVDPTTGNVVVPEAPANLSDAEKKEWQKHYQTHNIISVNKNTATGDPLVKYVVDTDPATSVDLLWGVAAATAGDYYQPITKDGQAPQVEEGKPFINLVKPNDPAKDRMQFNLKHALAKIRVTIDYIADAPTPDGASPAKVINADETRIYVRNFKMSGFATKGALNLNNSDTPGEPVWKDFDGAKDLAFDEVTFQDGRKDGKEGETNGAQNNETPQGLNPLIVENYCQLAAATDAVGNPGDANYQPAKPAHFAEYVPADATAGTPASGKNPGVTEKPQLLFGGTETTGANADNGYFYVIPRNEDGSTVDITIAYDVETIDPSLAGKLSDNETHGISIENVISKNDIFGGLDFKAGYQYEIKIHLGMTSVKVEATVTDWVDNGTTDVDLPYNQATRYNFASYNAETAGTLWGTGQIQFTGVKAKEYTQVKVLSNSTDASFVGKTYWVNSDATATGRKQLFLDNQGTIPTDPAIYVEIEAVKKYKFTSYSDANKTTQWATGTAETAAMPNITIDGKQLIVVLSNTEPGYVGKKYYVASNAATNGQTAVELFDESNASANIWVTIEPAN